MERDYAPQAATIDGSFQTFICSYIDSLLTIQQHPTGDTGRGKMVITHDRVAWRKEKHVATVVTGQSPDHWSTSSSGWNKLNVVRAFVEEVDTSVRV